jgi:hypothetical protein
MKIIKPMKYIKTIENYKNTNEDCGCNLSEELEYALKEGLFSSFRYGSDKFFEVINEARDNIDNLVLSDEDREFLNTDIGKKAIYNGKEVWLDYPIVESYVEDFLEIEIGDKVYDDNNIEYLVTEVTDDNISIKSENDEEIVFPSDFGEEIIDNFWNYFSSPIKEKSNDKYKGIKTGKPKRNSSGGKAYKVYVAGCNEKTKTNPRGIKMIRFGSGGLKAKINDPEARKRYDSRHGCSKGKHNDKCKPGYYSCRLPMYAKILGLSGSGKWW